MYDYLCRTRHAHVNTSVHYCNELTKENIPISVVIVELFEFYLQLTYKNKMYPQKIEEGAGGLNRRSFGDYKYFVSHCPSTDVAADCLEPELFKIGSCLFVMKHVRCLDSKVSCRNRCGQRKHCVNGRLNAISENLSDKTHKFMTKTDLICDIIPDKNPTSVRTRRFKSEPRNSRTCESKPNKQDVLLRKGHTESKENSFGSSVHQNISTPTENEAIFSMNQFQVRSGQENGKC